MEFVACSSARGPDVAIEVLLPKLGLTMESGLIEEWLVSAGTLVKPGEPLMRLATDKVEVDVEAEAEGLFHPAVAQGSELPPGALVGWLLAEGEAVPATSAAAPAAPTEAPQTAETVVAAEPGALTPPTQIGRQFVSPNARRVARERGVDVTQLRGTGPGGRVITADVFEAPEQAAVARSSRRAQRPSVVSPLVRRDAVAAGVDLGSVPAGPGGKIRRADVTAAAARQGAPEPGLPAQVIPLTGMRGVIASRMHASLQEMAQLTLGTDATMDAAVDLRARLKEQWSAAGIAVPTITDFIVRAAALALVGHPTVERVGAGAEHPRPVRHQRRDSGCARRRLDRPSREERRLAAARRASLPRRSGWRPALAPGSWRCPTSRAVRSR